MLVFRVPGRTRQMVQDGTRAAARVLRVETLEPRVVLSTVAGGGFAPSWCVPATGPPEISMHETLVEYGPQFDEAAITRVLRETAGSGGSIQPLVRANLLAPPMRGLDGLSDNVASAVAGVWDLPLGTLADSWVIGLLDGERTDTFKLLGVETVTATPHLPNTYIAQLAEPVDVGSWGYDVAAMASVGFVYPLMIQTLVTTGIPNDPLFPNQWHLRNTGQTNGTVGADANVVDVWDQYTGQGIVVAVVDDGLQHAHPDLLPNYVAALSYDFNDNDPDPTPAAGFGHGTAVGGVAAGRGNNGIGISGAAPAAGLSGIRLLGGGITDATIANALSFQTQGNDIYNNSWMPSGYGVLRGVWPLTLAALENNVLSGRDGLGSIYVFSAGNGLQEQDDVNYNRLANSRYTVTVAAIDHRGIQSSYSDPGAALMISGYSSGSGVGITTTDLLGSDGYSSGDYTNGFGGTSSAAPLVSGVIALMLDANPNLTWRDVQHVLVHSARKNHANDSEWTVNGAGHDVSHKYGFGAIDAQAAVDRALTWTTVQPEISASVTRTVNQAIPDNNPAGVSSTLNFTEKIRMEHVEVVFNATHPYRGDLRVVLTSPSGTQSVLAQTRTADSAANYSGWRFASTRLWDEVSAGEWTLTVSDGKSGDAGTFGSWQLIVHGTESDVFDFGDAPDTPYGTLLASDGPRHLVGGPILGWKIDSELDGQPSADASGDGDDEDGIVWIEPLVAGTTASVAVYASPSGGVLNYFFDFDGQGGFGNRSDEVFAATLVGGWNVVPVAVPADAVAGDTFARFRISSAGGLGPRGAAADGEVEDYAVTIFSQPPARDFGDAPDPGYRTLQENWGPSHIIGGSRLGSSVDSEADAVANATSTGDAGDDGIVFDQLLIVGQTATIQVTASATGGVLDYFFDFDGDGVFGNRASEVFRAELSGGTQRVPVTVPADAVPGVTYARFRLSSAGGLGPWGMAWDGEVEDYQVRILAGTGLVCEPYQTFDAVTAPALPTGWSTFGGALWRTDSSSSDTPPNAAFVPNPSVVTTNRLSSPVIALPSNVSLMSFRNFYRMEQGFDGGVLEISIAGAAPQDIIAAGGQFLAGGYNWTLSTGYQNPLGGRLAWSGNSGGFIDTIIQLPPAAIGKNVQFHWIEGTDNSVSDVGWRIDTIVFCREGAFDFDYGDAPDPPFATLAASGGAAHVVGGMLYLGAGVDADSDGAPSADASGDQDDGVTFVSPLIAGKTATIEVVAAAPGLLNAWIDFHSNGDWSDPVDQIFRDYPLAAGTNQLTFSVPDDAVATQLTFARFRLSSQAGLSFVGQAPDGEVEDYGVAIEVVPVPQVERVVVGDGSNSRSMVTRVEVTFNQQMVLDEGAFSVLRRGATGGPVGVSFTTTELEGKTVATLTFSGTFVETSGSLSDGNYELRIDAAKARSLTDDWLDGDGDGAAGGNYRFGTAQADAFFRLFGDRDGSRFVGFSDYAYFLDAFRKGVGDNDFDPQFDYDASGFIGFSDYAVFLDQFRKGLLFDG